MPKAWGWLLLGMKKVTSNLILWKSGPGPRLPLWAHGRKTKPIEAYGLLKIKSVAQSLSSIRGAASFFLRVEFFSLIFN